MKYGIYFQRSFWLVVPEVLYLVLLFGGWLTVVISAGMTIASIIRKEAYYWVGCHIAYFVSDSGNGNDRKDSTEYGIWRINAI